MKNNVWWRFGGLFILAMLPLCARAYGLGDQPVRLAQPSENAIFTEQQNIRLKADLLEQTNQQVRFYADHGDGKQLIKGDSDFQNQLVWQNVSAGDYDITAVLVDKKGIEHESAAVRIHVRKVASLLEESKVNGNPARNVYGHPPEVRITQPASGTKILAQSNPSFRIETRLPDAGFSDRNHIVSVALYNGDSLLKMIGSPNSSSEWTWYAPSPGKYRIVAKAVDNRGGVGVSSPVDISIHESQPPAIDLSRDGYYSTSNDIAPLTVTIKASVRHSEGKIVSMTFSNHYSTLVTLTQPPYTLTLRDMKAGDYDIQVRAVDELGLYGDSDHVHIDVREKQ